MERLICALAAIYAHSPSARHHPQHLSLSLQLPLAQRRLILQHLIRFHLIRFHPNVPFRAASGNASGTLDAFEVFVPARFLNAEPKFYPGTENTASDAGSDAGRDTDTTRHLLFVVEYGKRKNKMSER